MAVEIAEKKESLPKEKLCRKVRRGVEEYELDDEFNKCRLKFDGRDRVIEIGYSVVTHFLCRGQLGLDETLYKGEVDHIDRRVAREKSETDPNVVIPNRVEVYRHPEGHLVVIETGHCYNGDSSRNEADRIFWGPGCDKVMRKAWNNVIQIYSEEGFITKTRSDLVKLAKQ